MSEPNKSRQDYGNRRDQDREKGAVEQDELNEGGNTSMQGQLGHRDQDEMLKSSDTDYPEPDGAAEHSGEPVSIKKRRSDQETRPCTG